jgi:nucleotide-binding universal stress UspA family protein
MTYATIMVYVEADGTPGPRIRLAASLADKFNSMLIGMSAVFIPPPVMADGLVIENTRSDIEEMRARLADKGSWFRKIAGADRRRLEWRGVLDVPINALPREVRSADLVVVGRTAGDASAAPYPGSAIFILDPASAIVNMGRPTLVVPEGLAALQGEQVLVGWKDTREARRAVRDALPFLRAATVVTVVELCGDRSEEAARPRLADVVEYLRRHGIKSASKLIVHREGSGAAQLTQIAKDNGADLIVTGAYGHSRLGEWVFGGMTRDLLATSPVCCLMSH